MQAHLRSDSNLSSRIDYHENKVEKGKAVCIQAENFLKDLKDLTKEDILFHFERLNSLNDRVSKPNLHFSIGFHSSENFSDDRLKELSTEFMSRMGMDHQPYLVYRHDDAAHPHVHVLVPRIQSNGKQLEIGIRGFYRMHEITRDMEVEHGLVRIGSNDIRQDPSLPARKVIYGRSPTYAAVNQVLQTVVFGYSYTSLEELNVALRLYNVEASRGKPGSRLYEIGGLIYRVVENGQSIATPMKASQFTGKPTLSTLERRFTENAIAKERLRERMMGVVEWAFYRKKLNQEGFSREMSKEKVVVIWEKEDRVYFVDQGRKAVFEGESLGDKYQAHVIRSRLIGDVEYEQQQEKEKNQALEQDNELSL